MRNGRHLAVVVTAAAISNLWMVMGSASPKVDFAFLLAQLFCVIFSVLAIVAAAVGEILWNRVTPAEGESITLRLARRSEVAAVVLLALALVVLPVAMLLPRLR